MIRPFTLITMLLAGLSGAYLFAVKHQAQVLDDQIAAFGQSARLDAMRIRVLQGQWSLETDPTRLQQLAAQFTTLLPMQPSQLVTLAALRDSLPPPGSAAPAVNPAWADQSAPQLAAPDLSQNQTGLPLPPPLPPAPPMQLAGAVEIPPRIADRVSHATGRAASHSELHLSSTELTESVPPPRPYDASKLPRAASNQTVPLGAQVISVRATGASADPDDQDGGSVLGMASNLAPPQPMAGDDN